MINERTTEGVPSLENFDWLTQRQWSRTANGLGYSLYENDGQLVALFEQMNSSCARDWSLILDFFPCTMDAFAGTTMHGGFWRRYLEIRRELLDRLYSGRIKRFYASGYSMGASLGLLALQDAAFHSDRDGLKIEARGLFYAGSRAFGPSELVENCLKDRATLVHAKWDPVVRIPFEKTPTFLTLSLDPVKFVATKPRITEWRTYGRIERIGEDTLPLPYRHSPKQFRKALFEKFGR